MLWTFLLMLEISYNLRMKEGAQCRGSLWLRMRGIKHFNGMGNIYYEHELEFCYDMSRQGNVRL